MKMCGWCSLAKPGCTNHTSSCRQRERLCGCSDRKVENNDSCDHDDGQNGDKDQIFEYIGEMLRCNQVRSIALLSPLRCLASCGKTSGCAADFRRFRSCLFLDQLCSCRI